jgi:hypothetical protein
MEQLREQNEWGDLSDAEYRRLRSEVEAELLAIPGEAEKIVLQATKRTPLRRSHHEAGWPDPNSKSTRTTSTLGSPGEST